jgi:phage baseplate assembly protein W
MAIAKDRFDKASTKFQIYSDFLNDLTPHPVIKDVVRYTNEDSVNRAIRNLLLTNKGERPYQPNLGTDIRKLLFEPMGTSTASLLSKFIEETIRQYEPRAKVLNIQVTAFEEQNAYVVNLQYLIINRQEPVNLSVTLNRAR